MQLYCVRLLDGHEADESQIVYRGFFPAIPYLGYKGDKTPMLYRRGQAIKKAKLFGGKIEPFGENYAVVENTILVFPSTEISPYILKELNGREMFIDTEDRSVSLVDFIYDSSVFEVILGEHSESTKLQTLKGLTAGDLDELAILSELSTPYEYVMVKYDNQHMKDQVDNK